MNKKIKCAIPVILLAVLFVGFMQLSTSRVLDRAEAFYYRRMLVTKQGDTGNYRFFYVSNRLLEDSDGPLE